MNALNGNTAVGNSASKRLLLYLFRKEGALSCISQQQQGFFFLKKILLLNHEFDLIWLCHKQYLHKTVVQIFRKQRETKNTHSNVTLNKQNKMKQLGIKEYILVFY